MNTPRWLKWLGNLPGNIVNYVLGRRPTGRGASVFFGSHPSHSAWANDRAEQVRHYTGWNYVAVNAISDEIAANQPKVAARRGAEELRANPGLRTKCLTKAQRKRLGKALGSVQDGEEVTPVGGDHRLVKLLSNPNEPDTGFTFWKRTSLYLELTGIAYWWVIPDGLGVPTEMWALPPQWVWPRRTGKTDRLVDYYEIRPYGPGVGYGNHVHIPASDIIEFPYVHPLTLLDGFSPTTAIAPWLDVDESIHTSRWFMMKQGARPGSMVVELDATMADPSPDQIDRVRADIMALYQGEQNTGRPVIGAPGVKFNWNNTSSLELDHANGADQMRDYILAARRVGKSIAGMDDSNSYAGLVVSRANFALYTIRPKLLLIDSIITEKLAPRFDPKLVVYHEDNLLHDPGEDHKELMDELSNDLITVNEARAEKGKEPLPDGDVPLTAWRAAWGGAEGAGENPLEQVLGAKESGADGADAAGATPSLAGPSPMPARPKGLNGVNGRSRNGHANGHSRTKSQWQEDQHPRDHGKFSSKPGGGAEGDSTTSNPSGVKTVEDFRSELTPDPTTGRLGTKDVEDVVVRGYRVGPTDDKHGRGTFFSGDREGAEAYAHLHPGQEVREYTISLDRVLLAGHQNDVCLKLFGKTYAQMYGGGVDAGRKADVKVARALAKLGYSGVMYLKPAPPATTEIAVVGKDRSFSLVDEVEKVAAINIVAPPAVFKSHWEEDKHPRDHGMFSEKPGAEGESGEQDAQGEPGEPDSYEAEYEEYAAEVERLSAGYEAERDAWEARQQARSDQDDAIANIDPLGDLPEGPGMPDPGELSPEAWGEWREKESAWAEAVASHLASEFGTDDEPSRIAAALAEAGVTEEELTPLTTACGKAREACGKAMEKYAKALAAVEAQSERMVALGEPELPPEPVEPTDEPPEPDASLSDEDQAKAQEAQEAWWAKHDEWQSEHDSWDDRVQEIEERHQEKWERQSARLETLQDKLRDRAEELEEVHGKHREKVEDALTAASDAARERISQEGEDDPEPEEPDYPDEPQPKGVRGVWLKSMMADASGRVDQVEAAEAAEGVEDGEASAAEHNKALESSGSPYRVVRHGGGWGYAEVEGQSESRLLPWGTLKTLSNGATP